MKKLLITDSDRLAICEAMDILRRVSKRQEVTEEEARTAALSLNGIAYVAIETWEEEVAS